jgi:hypothetical protein
MNRNKTVAIVATLCLVSAGALAQDKGNASPSGSPRAAEGPTAGGVSEDLMKEFRGLDANKDGFLGQNELSSKPELASNFAKADKDRDGKLDPAEYRALKAETSSKGGE